MDKIERLKSINLVEHVQKYLWPWKKENTWYRFKSSKDDTTPSLLVYNDITKWYNDFSWRLWWGTIIDFHMNYFKVDLQTAISQLCEMYWIKDDDKKEFKKSPKRYEFVVNFENYRLNGLTPQLSRFLQTRWLKFEEITGEFNDRINEVSKEIWLWENHFVDKDGEKWVYKDVIIFPCYIVDPDILSKKIVWAKLRRCDGEKIIMQWDYKKSIAVSKPPKEEYSGEIPFSTWLLFSEISDDQVLVVEWETDYLILKILWFESVIWNLWWVSSNASEIQKLVKNTKKIVCLYDNDWPGKKWSIDLQTKIGRPIRILEYPKIDGVEKYDINDLFKMWYRKKDFDILIQNSILIDEKEIELSQPLFKDRYFYDDTKMEYFDIKDFSFTSSYTLSRHLFIKPKDLELLRQKKEIPTYEWICYLDWGKKWFYNLLDKSKIMKPSNTPDLNEHIEFLIENLCNNDEINMERLMKAILYKYTHLNDVIIPAVIFHGIGWTWKWLFVDLLEQIFWENNTLSWLRQENIESRFSIYTGQKLIVEFIELTVESFSKWKKNTNKLKSIVMEDKIQIEKKWQDPISTENIAWFIMSSNESKPIQLDSIDTGNRRFSVIKTGKFIPRDKWELIAQAIRKKENIENFLAYLFAMFPEVPNQKAILPLENQDKKDLEYLSESVWNLFFKWVEWKYPNINKISNHERESLLEIYREEIGETDWNDERYRIQYFNSWLSVRYKPTALQIRWKVVRWYSIDKDVSWDWEFPDWFFYKPTVKPKWILS